MINYSLFIDVACLLFFLLGVWGKNRSMHFVLFVEFLREHSFLCILCTA